MKLFKKVLAGVAVAVAMVGAHATTVGGVTWNPDDGIDFSAASVSIRQFIDAGTGTVSGFGTINTINGVAVNCPGCQLTFQFGSYTQASGLLPSPTGGTILYQGGLVNVYVHAINALNANASTMTAASTGLGGGSLWLALAGHANLLGNTFAGTVNIDPLDGVTINSLAGGGLLDVVGGLAAENLDTNGKAGGADLTFSTSFTTFQGPTGAKLLDSIGTGNFNGNSIPEPESLALVGLGLLGLAAARRRKSV